MKVLSFVAWNIRAFPDQVKPFSSKLAPCVLHLLHATPSECSSIRKDLLIGVRHILASELRLEFLPQIKSLLIDGKLVGSGLTCNESLRPLAYSTLADMVHHVRQELSLELLSQAIHLFMKTMADNTLPLTIQTMSCKLLLNLVEIVARKDSSGQGRQV